MLYHLVFTFLYCILPPTFLACVRFASATRHLPPAITFISAWRQDTVLVLFTAWLSPAPVCETHLSTISPHKLALLKHTSKYTLHSEETKQKTRTNYILYSKYVWVSTDRSFTRSTKGAVIRATKIVQLVRQHCCWTSCMSMLLVLPPQFRAGHAAKMWNWGGKTSNIDIQLV